LADLVRTPATRDRPASQHLEEHARSAPRRVLLLHGRHVAGAHCLSANAAALADADAALDREGKAAIVLRKAEMGSGRSRPVARPQTEILVEPIGVDDLAGVHLSVGVPDRLELPKRTHELVAVHLRQELAP